MTSYGTRLQKDLSASSEYQHLLGIPKALLPLDDDALISHWVKLFKQHNISTESVHVVTNATCYQDFLLWAQEQGIPEKNVVNDGTESNAARLGAVPDILFAIEQLQLETSDLLVVGGDTLFLQDFQLDTFLTTYNKLNQREEVCLVTTYDVQDVSKVGIVETQQQGFITRLLEKPNREETQSRSACPCFYLFHPGAIPFLREFVDGCRERNAPKEAYDATGTCLAYLCSRFKIGTFPISGRIDVGDLKSYIEANQYFKNKNG
ncbi:nucleotide-diphospho-sugar transferase [Sporodiniella umbellata]|nr:nucleotide-diphospho-sugar transferase [Sporodiniella umbellata]